jgi:hypothetical protein
MKSLEPPKILKTSRLVRPSSVKFCQNFLNLSQETVPLNKKPIGRGKNASHLAIQISFFLCIEEKLSYPD